jgi:rubrerythrin
MSKHGEGHKSALERLQGMSTIGEILATAMKFEKTAEQFYASLLPTVSKPLRELVTELVEEEKEHYLLFERLMTEPETEKFLAKSIKIPASDHKFSDYVHVPKLGENPDDQTILQYAMGREHIAAEQYASLARSAPEGHIQDLFQFLADEELLHKGELEKRYYEIVHSGGV